MKKRIFFDMDGTLVQWQYASVEELYSEGYFASLLPNVKVVELAYHFLIGEPDWEVFILSAVAPDCEYAIADKNKWLDIFLPQISRSHRIFVHTGIPKHLAVPGGVRETDVLVDDYSKNLFEWSECAVAVKMLNGINSTKQTWKGPRISIENDPQLAAEYIKMVAAPRHTVGKEHFYENLHRLQQTVLQFSPGY